MSEEIYYVENENISEEAGQDTAQDPVTVFMEENRRKNSILSDRFGIFAPITFLYACFYSFCMYKNPAGITYPFFAAATLLFIFWSLAKCGVILKKGNGFYIVTILLLSISTFCTGDSRLIFFNKLGIFLLTVSLLLRQFCDTEEWGIFKYLRAILFVCMGSLSQLDSPFADGIHYGKNGAHKINKKVVSAIVGALVALPILLVVLLLLSSADVLFKQYTDKILLNINFENLFGIGLKIVLCFFAAYCMISFLLKDKIKSGVENKRTGEPVFAITVTGMLTVIYLLFSVIQIVGLFMGKMALPAGYTYARYAREGFFQLLAVSFFNLVVVLVGIHRFRSSNVLKTILTVMSVCTYIMIASSAMRMLIYISFYYLTFLRILVLWGLALLAVLFAGVMICIFKENFGLFKYSMVVVSVMYLALSFSHPDYLIAGYNLAYVDTPGQTLVASEETVSPFRDYSYIAHLSSDAAPAVVKYMEQRGLLEGYEAYPGKTKYDKLMSMIGAKTSRQLTEENFAYRFLFRQQEDIGKLGLRTFNVSVFRTKNLLR